MSNKKEDTDENPSVVLQWLKTQIEKQKIPIVFDPLEKFPITKFPVSNASVQVFPDPRDSAFEALMTRSGIVDQTLREQLVTGALSDLLTLTVVCQRDPSPNFQNMDPLLMLYKGYEEGIHFTKCFPDEDTDPLAHQEAVDAWETQCMAFSFESVPPNQAIITTSIAVIAGMLRYLHATMPFSPVQSIAWAEPIS